MNQNQRTYKNEFDYAFQAQEILKRSNELRQELGFENIYISASSLPNQREYAIKSLEKKEKT